MPDTSFRSKLFYNSTFSPSTFFHSPAPSAGEHAAPETLRTFKDMYRAGQLDDSMVDIELPASGEGGARKVNIESGEWGSALVSLLHPMHAYQGSAMRSLAMPCRQCRV